MPAIDRSLDAVAFVSEHFRDILRRRLSEIAGLALITLALLGVDRARHLVGAGPLAQPCHADAGA